MPNASPISPSDRFAFLPANDLPLEGALEGRQTAVPRDSPNVAVSAVRPTPVPMHPHARAWESANDHLVRLQQLIDHSKLSDPASRFLGEQLDHCRTALRNVETAARALKVGQDSAAMAGPSCRRNGIAELETVLEGRCRSALAALDALAQAVHLHADALAPSKAKIAIHSVLCAAALIGLGVAMFATQGLALIVVMALAGFAGLNGALGWAEVIRAAMEKPFDAADLEASQMTLRERINSLAAQPPVEPSHARAAASEEACDAPMQGDDDAREAESSAEASDPLPWPVGNGEASLLPSKLDQEAKAVDVENDMKSAVAALGPLSDAPKAAALDPLIKRFEGAMPHEVYSVGKSLFGAIVALPDEYRFGLLQAYATACCFALGKKTHVLYAQAVLDDVIANIQGLPTEAQGYALFGLVSGLGSLHIDVQGALATAIRATAKTLPEAHRRGICPQ